MNQQPWLGKPWIDILFILLPPFLALGFIMAFPGLFQDTKDISLVWWVILILLIDVAHVYSTLYRTYFDKVMFQQQRRLLLAIPFISFVAGVMLYSLDDLWFWRVLAYVAVYHFIRQQYGFMRVYSRKEQGHKAYAWIDTITIYTATLYPILYWHLSSPRNFSWFVEGDFFAWQSAPLLSFCTGVYTTIMVVYVLKEVWYILQTKQFNIPRILVITGTILSWYFGIVYYNGDMAFTLLNVVAHGIPYMALVWIYGNKTYTTTSRGTRFLRLLFNQYGIVLFLLILFVLAFVEEGLWDAAVWQEHRKIFHFPNITLSNDVLKILVPLLALPQITHYILDGFIWKVRKGEFEWKQGKGGVD